MTRSSSTDPLAPLAPLAAALARSLERPRLLLGLLAVHVGTVLLFTLPLALALAPLLDSRPAARRLIAGPDLALVGELLEDHRELVGAAFASAACAMALYALTSCVATGGVLAALSGGPTGRARGGREVLAASGRYAGRMLRIGAAGLVLRIAPLLLGGVAAAAAEPLVRGHGVREVALGNIFVLGLFALSWSLTSVSIDYARGLALHGTTGGAFRLVRLGLAIAWREKPATLLLASFALAGFFLLTAIYHLIAYRAPNLPLASFAILSVLRLALALGRVTVSTTALIAASDVATARD